MIKIEPDVFMYMGPINQDITYPLILAIQTWLADFEKHTLVALPLGIYKQKEQKKHRYSQFLKHNTKISKTKKNVNS